MGSTVNIELGERSYEIRISPDLIGTDEELLPWISGVQVLIITNEVVAPLYLQRLKSCLAGLSVDTIILPDGERTKTLETASGIFDRMLEIYLDRTATVIALGGGVIGDMAGFAASCYQRGISLIQVPTTLLSQVDSSVGGKTAVNHPLGKNMIGTFYQPRRVLADISTLQTLKPEEFSAGMAEVIKYGLINDLALFQWLESNIDNVMDQQRDALEYIIEQSCINKARIVEQDERESGIRALLNLGHTFGHAIETATGYSKWLHGEAVAQGLVMAAFMSRKQEWIGDHDYERIVSLVSRAGLPTDPVADLGAGQLGQHMQLDKKATGGRIRLVLLQGIGQAILTSDYDDSLLDCTLKQFATG
jgi:3-dehydroquinate synthase